MAWQCVIFAIALLLMGTTHIHCWTRWNYTVQWDENPDDVGAKTLNWYEYWGETAAPGLDLNPGNSPRPRRGHSMNQYFNDPADTVYDGMTIVIMFGGRDNINTFTHIPRTYNVEKQDGVIVFTTYEDKPVNACNDSYGFVPFPF